jgi:hypothetical protein
LSTQYNQIPLRILPQCAYSLPRRVAKELKREDFRNFVHQQQFFQWQFAERNQSIVRKEEGGEEGEEGALQEDLN